MNPTPERIEPLISSSNYTAPTYATTAERLRARAKLIGPFGLDYISAAQMVAIADELEGTADAE